jgi:hypothetical protein
MSFRHLKIMFLAHGREQNCLEKFLTAWHLLREQDKISYEPFHIRFASLRHEM